MTFNFHHLRAYRVLILSSIVVLSACQKPPPEIVLEHEHTVSQANTAPDLSKICQDLKIQMQDMNDQRTTFALEQINQDIRMCLPLISFKEQKELLKLSDQMYSQFLHVDRNALQQKAFEQYAQNESQYPTLQQSLFEQLHVRDQYLIRHKGQAYIELMDAGKNHLFYRRNPQYFAKVFAPDLPQAEEIFLTEMANQNEQPLIKNNQISISPDEIMQRALFWENYLADFPKSTWRNDANYLYQTYTSLLFKGLDDQPVSTNYEDKLDIQPQTLVAVEQLAEQQGPLAEKAQRFLKIVDAKPKQNHANFIQARSISTRQVEQQVNLQDPLLINNSDQLDQSLELHTVNLKTLKKRDCFSDALCR
ncbi:hypothetical protein ACK2M2_03675 [Acinetobacter sp. TY1]|uniref:hypothetical protein n=1 Tax=Acinetobacter sp. TY1 TaxID=3387626 RepID=UPI003AF600A3